MATTCLLFVLASLYPEYTLAFQGLVALDIISHWMHMYRCDPCGAAARPGAPRRRTLMPGRAVRRDGAPAGQLGRRGQQDAQEH